MCRENDGQEMSLVQWRFFHMDNGLLWRESVGIGQALVTADDTVFHICEFRNRKAC